MIKQITSIFVIMGPSGSGKTAITSKVFPKTIKLSRILRGKTIG